LDGEIEVDREASSMDSGDDNRLANEFAKAEQIVLLIFDNNGDKKRSTSIERSM
jgi:hypothetical protein